MRSFRSQVTLNIGTHRSAERGAVAGSLRIDKATGSSQTATTTAASPTRCRQRLHGYQRDGDGGSEKWPFAFVRRSKLKLPLPLGRAAPATFPLTFIIADIVISSGAAGRTPRGLSLRNNHLDHHPNVEANIPNSTLSNISTVF